MQRRQTENVQGLEGMQPACEVALPIPAKIVHRTNGKRNFVNWIKAYEEYVEETEAPRIFHKLAGLWAISVMLRRHCWSDLGAAPNIFVLLVGPPGIAKKSTTLGTATHLIELADGVLESSHITLEALLRKMSKTREYFPQEGDPQYVSTPWAIALDEVQSLVDFEKPVLIGTLTGLYDSKYTRRDYETIRHGVQTIFAPCLTMMACTTTAHLQKSIGPYAKGNGLLSRVLLAWSDKKYRIIPQPHLLQKTEKHKLLEKRLAEDLNLMGTIKGEVRTDKDAVDLDSELYVKQEEISAKACKNGQEATAALLSREQGKRHKLALLYAVAGGSKTIRLEHMKAAAELLEELRHSTEIIAQGNQALSVDMQNQKLLWEFLARYPNGLLERSIVTSLWNQIPVPKIKEMLELGIKEKLFLVTGTETKRHITMAAHVQTTVKQQLLGRGD